MTAAYVFWIGLVCLAAGQTLKDGDVKLAGATPNEGLLMVYRGGRAGYVCDDTPSPGNLTTLGQVACRNLKRSFVSVKGGRSGSSSFLLDDVSCLGNEENLDQCKHANWGAENCGSGEHVFVRCTDLPCDGGKSKCSQVCVNEVTSNSFHCECRPGYSLGNDGISCIDIDECLLDNGGCSHTCVNTVGSHHCECPRYLYLDGDNSTCTSDGFEVDCSSSFGMTITLNKRQFFFLPDALTLTNTSCTSQSNSTHVWLYTPYNGCSTLRKVVGNEIIYSNAVLDSKTVVSGIKFFDSIKIPFQCRLSANRTISQGLQPIANQLIMRVDNSGELTSRFELLSGDKDTSPELIAYDIKQGDVIYAKLIPSVGKLHIQPDYCDVFSSDRLKSQSLITNGQPANFLTKILPSDHYRFSYPVFTFSSKGAQLLLECNSILSANSSLLKSVNETLIVTQQEVDIVSTQTSSSVDVPVPRVIDPAQGVSLECGSQSMKLTMDPSVTVGLEIDDLQPLKENCFGYYSIIENGNFVYSVPLADCGAEVKVTGNTISFTNSLVYSSNMTSKVAYFTDVILTHSCSYPLLDNINTLNYTVRSKNFAFGAENTKKANFDVSLNVFSDDKFKQLLTNGGSISVAEGRHLFGDIGVTSSDPNLKVALNECKVTPTNNPNDPNSHVVIKNGCKTAYGTRVFSPDRFSILTRSFASRRGQNVFLHCSVVVCGPSNKARCEKTCGNSSGVVGRRGLESSPPQVVAVSAGPFFLQ